MESPDNSNKRNPLVNIAAMLVSVAGLTAAGTILGIVHPAYSEHRPVLAERASSDTVEALGTDDDVGESPGGPTWKGKDVSRGGAHASKSGASGCGNCGVIENVSTFQGSGQEANAGAVVGSGIGAVAGSQIGRGNGRTVLGILGAVGGAYAAHAIERDSGPKVGYRVLVRMEDGTRHTVYLSAPPEYVVGEKVRVVNGTLAVVQG